LDQPDGCQEGPFINRQSVRAEESGDGLGEGESEPGKWRSRWVNSGGFRRATGAAVGSVAARTERGHLSTSPGATTPHPEEGQTGRVSHARIPAIYDRVCQQALLNRLEPIFEPIFDDASFGYRRGLSPKNALRKVWNRDPKRVGVDCRCGPSRLFRVRGSRKTPHAGSPTSSGRPSAAPDQGHAQGRKLRPRATLSYGFEACQQTIFQPITFDDQPGHWSSAASITFTDANGNDYRQGCAIASGTPF
jgi:hypothetical protein